MDEPIAPKALEVADARPPEFSDESLALRFSDKHADDARYVAAWGQWFLWADPRWQADSTMRAFDMARVACRVASAEAEGKIAAGIASAKTVAAVERLAKADRRHAVTVDVWDADPRLFVAKNAVVELGIAGAIRPARRDDYATKCAAAAPGGDCPQWRQFLDRVTGGDVELQAYLQRVAGYCLTGLTVEHVLFFLYGSGANGKSVFVNTLTGIWGDYATAAPMETFIENASDRHPTELAYLRGARLVVAHETEQGRRWAEAKIKAMTGGDRIAARFMRQNFFEYFPQFKLMIAGNHKPSLSSVDEAIRRRIHLVPFTVTIPPAERDPGLADKLKAEWGGILQWAIEGCLQWQRNGLAPPAAVRDATADYLAEEDAFSQWITDCCRTGRQHWGIGERLWSSWRAWAERSNERSGARKAFAEAMKNHGFEPSKSQHVRGYDGIDLIARARR